MNILIKAIKLSLSFWLLLFLFGCSFEIHPFEYNKNTVPKQKTINTVIITNTKLFTF